MIWRGVPIDPKDWGWEIKNDKFYPVYTDRQPAPKELYGARVRETAALSVVHAGKMVSTAHLHVRSVRVQVAATPWTVMMMLTAMTSSTICPFNRLVPSLSAF